MNKTKLFIIIIILIFFISILFILNNNNTSNNSICIMQNGKDVTDKYLKNISLSDDTPINITIKNNEDYNTFEVYKSKIKCIDSNCENMVCIETGEISNHLDNQMIVCLPHRLIVFFK